LKKLLIRVKTPQLDFQILSKQKITSDEYFVSERLHVQAILLEKSDKVR